MSEWPSTLPSLEQVGFSMEFPDGSIRTTMDAGRPFVRQRYTAAVEPFTGVLWLTADQYDTLHEFYIDTLGHGSEEFDWEHPMTHAAATVQFNERPKIVNTKGLLFEVVISAEVIP